MWSIQYFKKPNGPLFENKIYSIRPTKTGGRAIKELKKALKLFSVKIFTATKAEIGKAIIVENSKAFKETFKDKKLFHINFDRKKN